MEAKDIRGKEDRERETLGELWDVWALFFPVGLCAVL